VIEGHCYVEQFHREQLKTSAGPRQMDSHRSQDRISMHSHGASPYGTRSVLSERIYKHRHSIKLLVNLL